MLRDSILKLIGHFDDGYLTQKKTPNNNSLWPIARTLKKLC
ncbi:hypothetical protein PDR5_04930 [Pseudomonas sp. DR 5-09]|nr:hypothetical protein PDR5_04930 [Pseudomonas sp. DR 5-09]